METLKIYEKDLQIAKSLIKRDERVTRSYYYEECYPLFKAIYDSYYTDCDCCKEFMDEIYFVVFAPGVKTQKCQMENYRGESTLKSWLKAVCLCYCYKKYKRKPPRNPEPPSVGKNGNDDDLGDRSDNIYGSNEIDFNVLNRADVEALLAQMPNTRYRNLIRLRYLEQKTNEETAKELGMTMDNYYNKHKLAKEQYMKVLGKEDRHG